jgi:ribose transport system ATP-binding protein
MRTSTDAVLSIRGLTKRFGRSAALDDVSLDVRRGEIHGLLGENGAGKSTLIKILAGVYTADGGTIRVGEAGRAHERAVAFVHQDLGLIDSMSVADNVALQTGFVRRGPLIARRGTATQVARHLERVGLRVHPEIPVARLSQDEKVLVAVARALAQDAELVVLDEISASLPAPEMQRLQHSLRRSRDLGVSYLFVTHRLEEVFGIADRATVLRDGKVQATVDVSAVSHAEMVRHIVGHDVVSDPAADRADATADVALRVEGLSGGEITAPMSFVVRAGEVLAVCGLIGSGTRSVAGFLGGDQRPRTGRALLGTRSLDLGRPQAMRAAGCLYVPGDRLRAGVAADLTVRENLYLARGRLGQVQDRPVLSLRRERRRAALLADRFGVRPHGTEQRLGNLSGGNQQKVVIGRALRTEPRLLVLEDPTAGVDVGSRAELHRLTREAAARGAAVLLVSTDFDEVATQADRVLVMHSGGVTAELSGRDLTAQRLASASYGPTEHGPATNGRTAQDLA